MPNESSESVQNKQRRVLPSAQYCVKNGERAGFAIAFYYTSDRRDFLYFILKHGAAKGNRRYTQINADAQGAMSLS